MKLIPVFIGLLLITNKNGGEMLNNEKLALNLPVKNVELVERNFFDTQTTKNFSELPIQENARFSNLEVVKKSRNGKPNTISPNSCEQLYASLMAVCYTMA